MRSDLRKRVPLWPRDWLDGLHFRVLASIVFMFFSSAAPAVTFGQTMQDDTEHQIGVVETLFSTALCGVLFAVVGGQPLVVLGVTGPIVIFTRTIYSIAKDLDLDFLQFYAWIGIWSALMHWALALANTCRLLKLVTLLSCETFGVLIAIIYIKDAVTGFVDYFNDYPADAAFASLLVGLGTFYVAMTLDGVKQWSLFVKPIRQIIADYAMAIAIVIFAGLSYAGKLEESNMPRLDVPHQFQTTTGRGWLVHFWELSPKGVFVALGPGIILTILFFFDHNVSSLLSQKREFHLKKPPAYHWDFFVLGVTVVMCSLLGLPFANGLIPQAPLHVYSLATIKETYEERKKGDVLITKRTEVWTNVYENRVSPLMQSALIGIVLAPYLLETVGRIPRGVLMGLFLYMGFASFRNNQFFDRILLLVADPVKREKVVKEPYLYSVPLKVIVAFTLLQLLFLGGVVGITVSDTPAAIAFPVFITLAVPIRKWLLPRIPGFTHERLDAMDPYVVDEKDQALLDEPDDLDDADGQDNDLELATIEDRTNGDDASCSDVGGGTAASVADPMEEGEAAELIQHLTSTSPERAEKDGGSEDENDAKGSEEEDADR